MLRNALSTQPVECSRIKCPYMIEKEQLSSAETYNMSTTVEKTNINNVKDDQNGRNRILTGKFLFFLLPCSI